MHYLKRPRVPDEPMLLPLDYQVGENVVMIGRGRRCVQNQGNVRFRAMVKEALEAYSAGRKAKKSSIIKWIMREINSCCDDGIGFVKQDAMTGRYYTATKVAAKVTIAQAFRDALHDIGYKSSKQHKQFKRDVAKGKVDGCTELDGTRICSACNEQVDRTSAEEPPQQTVPSTKSVVRISPQLWEDSTDAGEAGNNVCTCEENHSCECLRDVSGCRRHTPPANEIDPFEPLSLGAVVCTEEGSCDRASPELESELSESPSTVCHHYDFADDTDDEDEHAMVAWAGEFVHCPLCSLIQGRGDFDELPIQDIRRALIG